MSSSGRSSGGNSSSSSSSENNVYTIGLTGSKGLVGTAFLEEIARRGHVTKTGTPIRVICLSRGETTTNKNKPREESSTSSSSSSVMWNPKGTTANEILHPDVASVMDAIVHLGGDNVSTGLGPLGFLGIRPWTDQKKASILQSRVETTRALSKVVAHTNSKLKTFLVASGVGVYGDKFVCCDKDIAPAPADETTNVENVDGFLAHVSREWEGATKEAKQSKSKNINNRVVNLRFGVVMSKKGGALQKLYPIFLLGGGGVIGSGKQYFTFISARDVARAILHTLETPTLEGPVNICAPEPCTNAEFTKALGTVLKRPTLLPFPGFAVSLLFGQMGEEMLLGGVRAVPTKLTDSGFDFLHPTITHALASAMEEDI
jgi:uncharacterized protein